MHSDPNHLKAVGIARPLRVAYLVDPTDCPDALLDEIFAEAYSRWGGRRTLIAPASADGVDDRYSDWLYLYDPDIIYSFVPLADFAVSTIHERCGPAYLLEHHTFEKEEGRRRYRINLQIEGLLSLSLIPVLLSRTWGLSSRIANLTLLDRYWDGKSSPFLEQNFGFLTTSFASGAISSQFPNLFSCHTLISPDALANRRLRKDPNASYATNEEKVLEVLATQDSLLTLSQLSDFASPSLDIQTSHNFGEQLSLVVGDTTDDRLLSWNEHHRYDSAFFTEVTTLRVSPERFSNGAFVTSLQRLIDKRGKRNGRNHGSCIYLRSCSLDDAALGEIVALLRKNNPALQVLVKRHSDHAACVPNPTTGRPVRTGYGWMFRGISTSARSEFSGNRFGVPDAMPWHMREELPPAGLRHGYWMIDVQADRSTNHSRHSNVAHTWVLPRRLRMERSFSIEWPSSHPSDAYSRFARVEREGRLSVPHRFSHASSIVITPDDLAAFEIGLCNDFEWYPFNSNRQDAPTGFPRYAHAEPSDKGRYLLGVLGRFNSLYDAFGVLMHKFWRDALRTLGAAPAERDAQLRQELLRTLRKRMGREAGELAFRSDAEWQLLAREAIRFGRKVQREQRYLRYRQLKEAWIKNVERDLQSHPNLTEDDRAYYMDAAHLDRSIQYLCQTEILFQGQEWRCQRCYNRNWIGIDELGRVLTCVVCGRIESAPVSKDWHFRANTFLVDAYRDHGVEAVVWTLWQLWKSAKASFYYSPSLWLWNQIPTVDGTKPDAEVDALAVVDGRVYLCEAKTSARLGENQVNQLVAITNRIRPDVLAISQIDGDTGDTEMAAHALREKLDGGVRVETMSFREEMLSDGFLLPY